MSTTQNQPTRFIALDVHKHYIMAGGVNAGQEVVLKPRKLSLKQYEKWYQKEIRTSDAVVIEATSSAWHLYDQLTAQGASVVVANPLLVKWIGSAPVKTDRHDTLKLARLLCGDLVPTVWVPPEHVRSLRKLIGQRQRLIRQRTRARNRLQSMLQEHQIEPPAGNLYGPGLRTWWAELDLSAMDELLIQQDLTSLDQVAPLIDEVDRLLAQESTSEVWAGQVPYLIQQSGIGLITAMTLLSAIGDITRFDSPKQLVGYAGLGAKVHDSGQRHHGGGITKQGRCELRTAMVEAAWSAVAHNDHWRAKFSRYAQRHGDSKAIVAIARHMLVSVWYLWHNRLVDRHSDPLTIARSFWSWAERGGKAMRHGLSCSHFVRFQLDLLGIGQELAEVRYGSHLYRLPAPGMVVALPNSV